MNTDLRQSQEYQEFLRQFGHTIEDVGQGQVGYVMRFIYLTMVNILVIQRVEDPIALSWADRITRRRHSLLVKVAPKVLVGSHEASLWETELKEHGYSLDKSPVAPTKTLVLDLGLSEMELLGQMKPKTRYNIRLSQRRGVTAKVVNGSVLETNSGYLDEFYTVYRRNCRRIGIGSLPRVWLELSTKTFTKNLFAVFAYVSSGELGAVASFVVAGDTVTYMINGATEEGRRDFVTDLVVWEGMLEGKRRECRWFDFDGVYDERYQDTENWKGFSRFKAGFGGQEVTYLGSYIKWWPFLKK